MARSRAHGLVAWSLRHVAQRKLILPASSELGLELKKVRYISSSSFVEASRSLSEEKRRDSQGGVEG